MNFVLIAADELVYNKSMLYINKIKVRVHFEKNPYI